MKETTVVYTSNGSYSPSENSSAIWVYLKCGTRKYILYNGTTFVMYGTSTPKVFESVESFKDGLIKRHRFNRVYVKNLTQLLVSIWNIHNVGILERGKVKSKG